MDAPFEVIGAMRDVEAIATGRAVRSRQYLRREYGVGRWRKMKGIALIRYVGGKRCEAEIHWYEAHGRGRVEFKVKRELS
jgi:hypothetical protein